MWDIAAVREREAQCVLVSEQLAQAGVTDRVSEESIRWHETRRHSADSSCLSDRVLSVCLSVSQSQLRCDQRAYLSINLSIYLSVCVY